MAISDEVNGFSDEPIESGGNLRAVPILFGDPLANRHFDAKVKCYARDAKAKPVRGVNGMCDVDACYFALVNGVCPEHGLRPLMGGNRKPKPQHKLTRAEHLANERRKLRLYTQRRQAVKFTEFEGGSSVVQEGEPCPSTTTT